MSCVTAVIVPKVTVPVRIPYPHQTAPKRYIPFMTVPKPTLQMLEKRFLRILAAL